MTNAISCDIESQIWCNEKNSRELLRWGGLSKPNTFDSTGGLISPLSNLANGRGNSISPYVHKLMKAICSCNDLYQLSKTLSVIIGFVKVNLKEDLNQLISIIQNCFDRFGVSSSIKIIIDDDDGCIYIVPNNIPHISNTVFPYLFHWLKDYDEVKDKYILSLEYFKSEKYRDSCDNARLSLEILLKNIFNKGKQIGLEQTFRNDVGGWLKKKGCTTEFRNLFTNCSPFIDFINKDSKHSDKIGRVECEYVIYYISLVMKVLIENKNISKIN